MKVTKSSLSRTLITVVALGGLAAWSVPGLTESTPTPPAGSGAGMTGGYAAQGAEQPGAQGDYGPGCGYGYGMGPGMMGFGNTGPAASAIPSAAEVRVEASNFAFTPNEIRLPASAEVNLVLVNTTSVTHDLTVPALGIHVVAGPGQTSSVGLRGLAAGRYDAYCSVPGHTELGMRATVVVQ